MSLFGIRKEKCGKGCLEPISSGGGGVTSWNDLPDKPFGELIEVKTMLLENGVWTKKWNPEKYDGQVGVAKYNDVECVAHISYSYSYESYTYVGRVEIVDNNGTWVDVIQDDSEIPTGLECIYITETIPKPIDESYIPEEIARMADVIVSVNGEEADEDGNINIASATLREVYLEPDSDCVLDYETDEIITTTEMYISVRDGVRYILRLDFGERYVLPLSYERKESEDGEKRWIEITYLESGEFKKCYNVPPEERA